MYTLNLNKKYQGYYHKRFNDIQVIVLKNDFSGGWEGVIQKYTHTAKDVEGTKVEMFDNLTECFYGKTKKEVSYSLTNWILNNQDVIEG